MSQPQCNFTLLLRVWSASPSPWQNYSLHRDLLAPSPSPLHPSVLVPPALSPSVQLIPQWHWGLQLGGHSRFPGVVSFHLLPPAVTQLAPLGEAATAGWSAGVRCRNCLTRLCHQNDVTVLQCNFLSSCDASDGVCGCESACSAAFGGAQRLRHKPCPLLARLPPQAALWSDDVQFPPLD